MQTCWIYAYSIQSRVTFYPKSQYGVYKLVCDVLICGYYITKKKNSFFFSFHWVLVALEMKRMIAYYLDPMAYQPCDDLREIVNM